MNLTAKYLRLDVEPETISTQFVVEKAETLIKAGKLRLVQSEADIEEYCKLCSQALERINSTYYPRALGWIDWLKNHKPNLWREIENAEKELESPIDRGISLSEFARLVNHWEFLVRQAAEFYLNRGVEGIA